MKLTITKDNNNFISLQLHSDITINEFKSLCSAEIGIPSELLILYHYGKIINSNEDSKLKSNGISDGDVLVIGNKNSIAPLSSGLPFIDFKNIQIPETSGSTGNSANNEGNKMIKTLKSYFSNNPQEMKLLSQRNPDIVDALMKNDTVKLNKLMQKFTNSFSSPELNELENSNEDFLNPGTQEKIANMIHQKNIDANMETALEHTPESFGTVTMLFINMNLNGMPVKAFVDTGAQATLISKSCAERCHLLRLVDKRWQGIAKGVGTQTILGRIHLTQMVIENVYIACSFSVLENQPMDVLLGLDILKRYQCQIDLKSNLLIFTTYGVSTRFLDESELPFYAQHSNLSSMLTHEDNLPLVDSNSDTQSFPNSHNSSSVKENDVERLVEMGFTREAALKELQECNGNIDLAAQNLANERP